MTQEQDLLARNMDKDPAFLIQLVPSPIQPEHLIPYIPIRSGHLSHRVLQKIYRQSRLYFSRSMGPRHHTSRRPDPRSAAAAGDRHHAAEAADPGRHRHGGLSGADNEAHSAADARHRCAGYEYYGGLFIC